MKNTLKIGIKETTTEVLMYSSYDDGTNRLFVGLEASIAAHPWIQIGSSAKIYATSNDWRYEIEPTTWRGDSTFTITAGDDNNAGTVYTISQVPAAVTSNIGLEHTGGNTYRLTYTVGSGVDTANDIVTFTSSDVEDGQATAWTSVAKLESGETHASMFAKISQMFKNVRYLYKTLGNTDLSAIGGGTISDIIQKLTTYASFNATAASGITINSQSCYKVGTSVVISICFIQFALPATWSVKNIASIPSAYAPKKTIVSRIVLSNGFVGILYVYNDGKISIQSTTSVTGNVPNYYTINLAYPISI